MKLSKNSTVDDKVHEEKISGPRQKKKVLGQLPQLDDKHISKYLFHLFLSIVLNLHQ